MKKTANKDILSRGYEPLRKRINNNSRYSRSCFNCAYYYQAVGDKEEVCQNQAVFEYDMIVDGHTIYCTQWKLNSISDNKLFKSKSGRSKLD